MQLAVHTQSVRIHKLVIIPQSVRHHRTSAHHCTEYSSNLCT